MNCTSAHFGLLQFRLMPRWSTCPIRRSIPRSIIPTQVSWVGFSSWIGTVNVLSVSRDLGRCLSCASAGPEAHPPPLAPPPPEVHLGVTCRPLLLIFCCASSPSASQAPSHLEAESLLRILPNPKTQLLVDSRRPGGPPAGTQVPVTVTATMLCRRLARLHTIVSPSSWQLEPRACHGTWTEGPRVAVCSSLSGQERRSGARPLAPRGDPPSSP